MKRIYSLVLLVCLTVILVPKNAYADVFSKPSATIEIKGVKHAYDFEVLVPYEMDAEVLDPSDFEYRLEGYYKKDYPINQLNGYQDADGFVARTIYSRGAPTTLHLISDNVIQIGYFGAPRTFKILLIIDDNIFITSKVIHRKMFESKMSFDLEGVDLLVSQTGVGKVNEKIPMLDFTQKFIVRVFLTVGIELLILFLFMYTKKRNYLIVGALNLITQSLLTIGMVLGYYFWAAEVGLFIIILFGEIAVFLVEMLTYYFVFDEKSKSKALLYGFVANLATLLLSVFTIGYFI